MNFREANHGTKLKPEQVAVFPDQRTALSREYFMILA